MILKTKKGFLVTIMAFLLLLPIFYLSSDYISRNKELQSTITASGLADKIRYVEDDIISNAYQDLTSLELTNITRTDNINISFTRLYLAHGRDIKGKIQDYKDFIGQTYSSLNNLNITLEDFHNNFTIHPYNSTFEIQGQNITILSMPVATNYVQKIAITADISAKNDSGCEIPSDDNSDNPELSITYKYMGGSCTNIIQLSPTENNDVTNKQFYLKTTDPNGFIDIKYGRIDSDDGVLSIATHNITANITELDLIYDLPNEKVKLKSGSIEIKSKIDDMRRKTQIVLAEE